MIATAKEFGDLIRSRRKTQGLTQNELAARCGVGQRFVIELESGKPSCHLGKALTVARELGIRLEDAAQHAPQETPEAKPDDELAHLPRF